MCRQEYRDYKLCSHIWSQLRSGIFVMDINTNNVYTITGLIPRTGYTIQVRADHATVFGTLMGTVSATVNAETAVPEGEV